MSTGRRVIALFVLALAVRLAYLAAGVEVPPQDTADYDEIARNLLAGEGFVATGNWFGHQLRAWRAPGYPFFLAAVYGLFGESHGAVRVVQALLGAGTVLLVYGLALRLRPQAALLAGLAAACYPPLVASANEVMTETLYTALWVGGLWAVIEARHRGTWRVALVGGALLGLAGLTRPVGLLAVPACLAVVLWEERRRLRALRRWLPFAAALTAGTAAVLLPWTARNAVTLEAFVPVSTHGGFIIARSNADAPAWRQARGWGIAPSVFAEVPDEVERDRRWLRQGLGWIATHPGAWLRLAGERLLRFLYVFRPDYNAGFAFLLPVAAAGLWRWGGEPGFRHLSAACGLSLVVFVFLLYGSTRFRLPMEPLLLPFGAAAAVWLRRAWGNRLFGAAVAAWAALHGALWLWAEPVRAGVVGLLRAWGLK